MGKVKEYAMFGLKVVIVLAVIRLIKPMVPEAIGKYLP